MPEPFKLSQLSKELQAKIKQELSSVKGAYWNSEGDFQREYEQIWKDFIPSNGEAKSIPAEAVRAVSRLYHDCYNNGWGNNKRPELTTLLKTVKYFKPFYKGSLSLTELLLDLKSIQNMIGKKGWFEKVQRFSKARVEPDLDNLVDAVVQYAYKELYENKEEVATPKDTTPVEIERATSPKSYTVINIGISDTVIIRYSDLEKILNLKDKETLRFADGDNLNAAWNVTREGDSLIFKATRGSSTVIVKLEDIKPAFFKEESAVKDEFKLVEKSLNKFLYSIITKPTLSERLVPVDSYKINNIETEKHLKNHLGNLVIDVTFKKANYLPPRFVKGVQKDLETLLYGWADDELNTKVDFHISLV